MRRQENRDITAITITGGRYVRPEQIESVQGGRYIDPERRQQNSMLGADLDKVYHFGGVVPRRRIECPLDK